MQRVQVVNKTLMIKIANIIGFSFITQSSALHDQTYLLLIYMSPICMSLTEIMFAKVLATKFLMSIILEHNAQDFSDRLSLAACFGSSQELKVLSASNNIVIYLCVLNNLSKY